MLPDVTLLVYVIVANGASSQALPFLCQYVQALQLALRPHKAQQSLGLATSGNVTDNGESQEVMPRSVHHKVWLLHCSGVRPSASGTPRFCGKATLGKPFHSLWR